MSFLRLHRSLTGVSLSVGAVLLVAQSARAQNATDAPAHIAVVDGAASLDREGQTEPAVAGVPFVAGDRLRTESGRVEILFPDGSALDIDEFASIDLLSGTLLRLTEGRVLLTVAGANNPAAAVRYQIDTPVASAVTEGPGEFRVALFSAPAGLETELAVLRGFASLATERGSINVRAGQRTVARDNESPIYPQAFNSARFDAFDRWAEARRFDRTRTTASTQYLPGDLRMYGGTFDRHGAWQYESPYGYVWYPSVTVDWRPYYNGYWSSIAPYGWTWVGLDVWSWPTHHYGRWGHARDRWFWIPERRWASAWVAWGAAPGYVSWCPLGFDNRPVFGLSVNIGNPWTGWVIIPRTHFGGYDVDLWAIAPHRLHRDTPFVMQASAPVPPARTYAVPRTIAGAGASAGRVAVPRNGVGSQQLAVGGKESVGDRRSAVSRQPAVSGQQSAVDSQRSAIESPRLPVRSPQPVVRYPGTATSDRQPYAGAQLPVDRSRPSAIPRQSSGDGRLEAPGAAAPTVDRTRQPAERGPRGDVWLKQPLPQAPRAYQRYPGAPTLRNEAPDQSPQQPERSVMPRWSAPGAADRTQPQNQKLPATVPPPSAAPRMAAPRWEGYAKPPAQSGPPPEAARPPAFSRSPDGVAPRSGPPPSTAPSAPAAAAPPPSRSKEGGGDEGARQRHP